MPVKADQKYTGRIVDALVPDTGQGSPCLQVTIETEAGRIDHRMYLSPAARKFTEKVLFELGLENSHLTSEDFWVNPLKYMEGLECSIETEEYCYQNREGEDRTVVRVKWLNGPRREVKRMAPERARGLAGLFQRANYDAPAPPPVAGNEDVPF